MTGVLYPLQNVICAPFGTSFYWSLLYPVSCTSCFAVFPLSGQDLRFLSFVRLESWELRCRGFELWESKNKLTWQVSCTPYRMWSVLLLEPHFIDLCLTQCPVPPVLLFSSLQDSCPVPWFCSFQMLLPARLPSPFPPPFPPLSPLPDLALRGFERFWVGFERFWDGFEEFSASDLVFRGFEVVYIGFEVVYIGFEAVCLKNAK